MAVLAILQADPRAAARLQSALGRDHQVVVRGTWESFNRLLAREAFDGCLVDADQPDPESARHAIEALREKNPGLAIIACVEPSRGLAYYDLGEIGVSGILTFPQAATKIRATVDGALATARADRIARSLEDRYAAPGPDAIGWAVEHAGPHTSVEKLAAALGHTPRSLRAALEEAGLPAPTRVLVWGRLLLAGARLGRDGRTVEEVAFSLGYSAATSLARAMKQQTGLTPGEVSERGGMERVRDVLFPEDAKAKRMRARLGKIASIALLAALAAGCATFGTGDPGVDRGAIDALLDAPPMDQAHFGVLAIDAHSGRRLYARNVQQWFVPASNQKILVTAAAWSLLGPDYRYRTEVWATAPSEGEHLDGNLVLVGSGDPSLSARYWGSSEGALDALADSLWQAGLGHVMGSLVVDASGWDSTTIAPTREVADLAFGYGATGGAFAIDEGSIEVVVTGGSDVGAPAAVRWTPPGTDEYVQAHVTTVPADSSTHVDAHYLPESRRLVLDGEARLGLVDTLYFAQRDPVRQATAAAARAMERRGIHLDGWQVRWTPGEPVGSGCVAGSVPECPGAHLLATLESPPLSELVAAVLGPSQNWITEQLVRTLGAERGERGDLDEGLRLVRDFLTTDVGIDSLDVSARDGSGLSAYNLVTPRALVRVLQYMAARPDAAAYRAAMAEPGEKDSTLEERLAGLEGRLFAKTGSISNVNTLSGYLVRASGEDVIFSILSNGAGVDADQVRETIDEVVRTLAR